MHLITPIYLDASLLPHFLRHYSALGVTAFHFSLNTRLNAGLEEEVRRWCVGAPAFIEAVYEMDDVTADVAPHLNRIRERCVGPDEWLSVVDLDEFYELPAPLPQFLAERDALGEDHVVGRFVDRLAPNGALPPLGDEPSLSLQFPLARRITRMLAGGNDAKVVLQKGRHTIVRGHHVIEGGVRQSAIELPLNHYKWKAGVIERLRERLKVHEARGLPWADESRRLLAHYEAHGRIDVDDPRFG